MVLHSLVPVFATPVITEQVQDGDFCNRLKVTGTGTFEVGVSIKDRQLALEYYNFMYGGGDLEMDTGTVEAQRTAKLPDMRTARPCRSISGREASLPLRQDPYGWNEIYQLQSLLGRHRS